jgi:hypothetical protein
VIQSIQPQYSYLAGGQSECFAKGNLTSRGHHCGQTVNREAHFFPIKKYLAKAKMYSEIKSNLRLIPNQITAIRFILIPLMWVWAFQEQITYIGIGLAISLVTDLLDGAVARKLNQTSDFGSKFDSLSD